MIFPIGVEDHAVHRVPVVSIGVAALCVAAFLFTWVLPRNPEGPDEEQVMRVVQYWADHPELSLREDFTQQFLTAEGRVELERMKRAHAERQGDAAAPDSDPDSDSDSDSEGQGAEEKAPPNEATLGERQRQLDAMVDAVFAESGASTLRRLSLQPSRGPAQVGWLTHMFLHFGWLHILGNLFFFYLVGPLLEDVWGRRLFAGFYVVGGLVAALAHYLIDIHSPAVMAGASGAVAACMGAFALRYATRRVRMAYVFWLHFRLIRGTFFVPAWLWGLFWFGSEVLDFFVDGGSSGVAVMAHIGGFAFGFGVAAALKATGIEKKYVAPSVEKEFTWEQHPGVVHGLEALERGDRPAAQQQFLAVLKEQPQNAEAALGLARLELLEDKGAEATRRLEPIFTKLAQQGRGETLARMVGELGPAVGALRLRPPLSAKVAEAVLEGPEELRPLAEPLFVRGGDAGGVLGAKSLLRAAELRIAARTQGDGAERCLEAARKVPGLPQDLQARIDELLPKAVALRELAQGAPPAPGEPSAPASPIPVPMPVEADASASGAGQARIIPCRLLELREHALEIESKTGNRRELSWREVVAIAVGMVPEVGQNGATRQVLITDLVLSWGDSGAGPLVLRLPSNALGLTKLFPDVPPKQAYGKFLARVFEGSGAVGLPDKEALLRGEFPRYEELSAFEAAQYASW